MAKKGGSKPKPAAKPPKPKPAAKPPKSQSGSRAGSVGPSEPASEVGSLESLCAKEYKGTNSSFTWNPSVSNVKQIEYVRKLECELEQQQHAFLHLTAQFARLQFRLRQLMQAQPLERRDLLKDLERIAFQQVDAFNQCKPEELPRIELNNQKMGNMRYKQTLMVCRQRNLIGNLRSKSECLQTEYKSDPAFEMDQEKKCPPLEGAATVYPTKSKDSLKK